MAHKQYIVKHSRAGFSIEKGQLLSLNQDRINMLLGHGLIEEVKSDSVSEKPSAPNGAGNEVAKKKK